MVGSKTSSPPLSTNRSVASRRAQRADAELVVLEDLGVADGDLAAGLAADA